MTARIECRKFANCGTRVKRRPSYQCAGCQHYFCMFHLWLVYGHSAGVFGGWCERCCSKLPEIEAGIPL